MSSVGAAVTSREGVSVGPAVGVSVGMSTGVALSPGVSVAVGSVPVLTEVSVACGRGSTVLRGTTGVGRSSEYSLDPCTSGGVPPSTAEPAAWVGMALNKAILISVKPSSAASAGRHGSERPTGPTAGVYGDAHSLAPARSRNRLKHRRRLGWREVTVFRCILRSRSSAQAMKRSARFNRMDSNRCKATRSIRNWY